MIIKYCDRCKKKIDGKTDMMQCKLPTYRINALYLGVLRSMLDIDLCSNCQSELDSMISTWIEDYEEKES